MNCACDRSINTRSSLHIKQSKLKKVKISFRYILGRMKWVRSESDRQGKFLLTLTTFFDISAGFLKRRRTSSMPRGRILIISSIISLGGPLYSAIDDRALRGGPTLLHSFGPKTTKLKQRHGEWMTQNRIQIYSSTSPYHAIQYLTDDCCLNLICFEAKKCHK